MRTVARYAILNAILLACITAMITPSFASQEHLPLVGGAIGGFIVGLLMRTPGAVAEWCLSWSRYRLIVYVAYGVAGVLTALVIVANHATHDTKNPLAGSLLGSDALGSMTGIYLFLSSAFLVLPAVVVLAARLAANLLTRRYARRYTPTPAPPHLAPPPAPAPAPAPVSIRSYLTITPAANPHPPSRPQPAPGPPAQHPLWTVNRIELRPPVQRATRSGWHSASSPDSPAWSRVSTRTMFLRR
jgi:hypothetical protein